MNFWAVKNIYQLTTKRSFPFCFPFLAWIYAEVIREMSLIDEEGDTGR